MPKARLAADCADPPSVIAVQALPADWQSLLLLTFVLGMKHGFDADHLATIDGLTRLNARHGRPFARYCGALFSLVHGAVVIAIALAVGLASERWNTRLWLDAVGAWVSIVFLTALGIVNLRAVLAAEPGQVVAPVGLKGRFLGRRPMPGAQARSRWSGRYSHCPSIPSASRRCLP